VQESILEAHPRAAVQVAIVWADRYPGDDAEAASEAARRLGAGDPRVVHYVEAEDRPVGLAVSAALGWPVEHDEAAWDIYLFWPPGAAWGGAMPAPEHVFYQLGAHADEPGFAQGDDLAAKLRETASGIATEPAALAGAR
jgi:hypothetical protein